MAAERDDLVYVDDILGALGRIKRYCKDVKKEEFVENEMLRDAVVRNLEIIGEASSKLSESFRNRHKEIEWRKIIGMRNRIIHAYDIIDYEIVWDVVKADLPQLEAKLRKLAKPE
ncbi:MAG: DUF86 domain-containing protein [Candidatus Micrarchaeota archaeon]